MSIDFGGVLDTGHLVGPMRGVVVGHDARHDLLVLSCKGVLVGFTDAGYPDDGLTGVLGDRLGRFLFSQDQGRGTFRIDADLELLEGIDDQP